MPDRGKVIKGLEKCKRCECDDCTEKGASQAPWDCPAYDDFVDSAIVLLKEQEPVKPIPFFESPNYVVCGHCKSIKAIMPKHTKQKYCHECGTPVLWEGL